MDGAFNNVSKYFFAGPYGAGAFDAVDRRKCLATCGRPPINYENSLLDSIAGVTGCWTR